MNPPEAEPLPPYAFVPGGPWPHPTRSADGHSFGHALKVDPIEGDQWERSIPYLRGFVLFDAGYYWEAHEVWESLWHAHGRNGPTADLLKGLIKLAAAGVKVREGQPHGIAIHARRAAELFESARRAGSRQLGLDFDELIGLSRRIAENPPGERGPLEARVWKVFDFQIRPAV